ncbi:uncharacterized protein METZ01_LOCUS321679, partial [marine metagenome]
AGSADRRLLWTGCIVRRAHEDGPGRPGCPPPLAIRAAQRSGSADYRSCSAVPRSRTRPPGDTGSFPPGLRCTTRSGL